jgi:hypothetical protein
MPSLALSRVTSELPTPVIVAATAPSIEVIPLISP